MAEVVGNRQDELEAMLSTSFMAYMGSGRHFYRVKRDVLDEEPGRVTRRIFDAIVEAGFDKTNAGPSKSVREALTDGFRSERLYSGKGGLRSDPNHPNYGSFVLLPYLIGEREFTHPLVQSFVDDMSRCLHEDGDLMGQAQAIETISATKQQRDVRDVSALVAARVVQLDELAGVGR